MRFLFLLPIYLCAYTFDWQSVTLDDDKEKELQESPYIAISLGKNCGVASRFCDYKIRRSAFPFDWLVTPFDAVYSLIESDFSDFLNPKNFELVEDHIFVDKKFHINFYHDFTAPTWQNYVYNGLILDNELRKTEYETIYNKYCRRVAYFYFVLNSQIPIYLFRTGLQKSEAFKLYNLLTTKFLNKNIVLIALQVNPNGIDEEWLKDKMYCFSLGKDGTMHESAKADHPDWQFVLGILGLLK